MSTIRKTALAVALGLSSAAAMAAPVVLNGGFEDQQSGSSTWNAANWTGEGSNSGDAQRSSAEKYQGSWSMKFGDDKVTTAASISGFTASPQTVYELSFFFKGKGDLKAKLDRSGSPDESKSFDGLNESSWKEQTFRFLATAIEYSLSFDGEAASGKSLYIDSIALNQCSAPSGVQSYGRDDDDDDDGKSNYNDYSCGGSGNVPLPATLPLLGLGFLGLGLARRKLAA